MIQIFFRNIYKKSIQNNRKKIFFVEVLNFKKVNKTSNLFILILLKNIRIILKCITKSAE